MVLPLLLLVACGGQSGEEPALVAYCEVLSDTPVPPSDTALGFSAEDVVAHVDGRAWDMTWRTDEPEWYAASPLARVAVDVSLGSARVRQLELTDAIGRECSFAGTFLLVPTTLALADADGTFAASGSVALAASALTDAGVLFGYELAALDVALLPADLTAAAEASLAHDPDATFGSAIVTLSGPATDLELTLDALSEQGDTRAAVGVATLTPAVD